MKLIVACATDDGRTITSEHFGSARTYAIYELDEKVCAYVQSLPNTTKAEEGEHAHGDPQKAKSVTELLRDKHVQVVMAKNFGPNISRIKRMFVPVIVKTDSVDEGCMKLAKYREAILAELNKGETRSFLLLS